MRKRKRFEGKSHVYDTERSTKVGTRNVGCYGDPAGFQEILYKTKAGLFFVVGKGGETSPYPVEDIRPISAEEAGDFGA